SRAKFGDDERGVERIAHVHRLQEAGGLLEEGDERLADDVWKDARARRRLRRDEKPMGEQVAVPMRLTVDAVVVDRVIVPRGELESAEECLGHGARGNVETLPHRELVEVSRRRETMRFTRELGVGHRERSPFRRYRPP